MGSGIESIDMMVGQLRSQIAKEHPGYNGTVPENLVVPVGDTFWGKTGVGGGGLVSNPVAQRNRKPLKVSEQTNVPAGNLVVLDQDMSIIPDVIRDIIATEPDLDGFVKSEGVVDRLCNAIIGNVQHMNLPASVKPWKIVTDIYTATNLRYLRSQEIPRKEFLAFSNTLWSTLVERQDEINFLEPLANQQFMSPINKTPDGRLLVYHTTASGKSIGETGELLSATDVAYMTGNEPSGLGGTPNRISYTYNFTYAVHVAKMMANMNAMVNMASPWKKMSNALTNVVEEALVDNEPGLFNDHIRNSFDKYAQSYLPQPTSHYIDILKNDGMDTLLNVIDNALSGDMNVDRIRQAETVNYTKHWWDLGNLHDGLQGFNEIFGTPYAMLTMPALNNVVKNPTPTKDLNVVTYEYAVDPNMLTEHVRSEFEIRTYSTINIEPTGRIFDRTGEVIKTIDEGEITRQGLLHGHLLAQRKRNYRGEQPDFVTAVETQSDLQISFESFSDATSPSVEVATQVYTMGDVTDAFNFLTGNSLDFKNITDSPVIRNLIRQANQSRNRPKWVMATGVNNLTVDNSLVYNKTDKGIFHVSSLMRDKRSRRVIIDFSEGTSILQVMTLDFYGRPEIEQHVIPTNELLRNAEWLTDMGMPRLQTAIDNARLYSQTFGKTVVQTPFENFGPDEYSEIEVMYYAMLLQNDKIKTWVSTATDIDLAVHDHPKKQELLDAIYNAAESLQKTIGEFVYGTSAVHGSARSTINVLNDYVEDPRATSDTKLGLDKPITNGIPNYIDIGTNPINVILHTYEHLDPVTGVLDDKYYMTIKNGKDAYGDQSVEAFELAPYQWSMIRTALSGVDKFSADLDVPNGITLQGKSYSGTELMDFNVRRRPELLKDIIDELATTDPAILQGAVEVDVDSSAYMGTTDIVSTVGFQVLNDGGYITNNALVSLLKARKSGLKQTQVIRKRFEKSFGEQLVQDKA
jgi:hypothetical protein